MMPLGQRPILKNNWNFRPTVSVEVSMNTAPPQSTVLPAIRNAFRQAGDTAKKLKAGPEHEHINGVAAMRHQPRWHHDCTKMLDLL